MREKDLEGYVISLNEVLTGLAREAKVDKEKSQGTRDEDFRSGYLSCFHRIVTLMQQQAEIYDLDLKTIGLDNIDESDLV